MLFHLDDLNPMTGLPNLNATLSALHVQVSPSVLNLEILVVDK